MTAPRKRAGVYGPRAAPTRARDSRAALKRQLHVPDRPIDPQVYGPCTERHVYRHQKYSSLMGDLVSRIIGDAPTHHPMFVCASQGGSSGSNARRCAHAGERDTGKCGVMALGLSLKIWQVGGAARQRRHRSFTATDGPRIGSLDSACFWISGVATPLARIEYKLESA